MIYPSSDYFDFSFDFILGCENDCSFCNMKGQSFNLNKIKYSEIAPGIKYLHDVFLSNFPPDVKFIHCSQFTEPRYWNDFTWMIFFDKVRKHPLKRFLIQTRHPRYLIGKNFPSNVMVGISCENQETFELRLEALNHIDAKRKFIVFEPLKGKINLCSEFNKIDWAIIGLDNRKIKLNISTEKDLAINIKEFGTPLFVRNIFTNVLSENIKYFPCELRFREFPK